MENNLLDKFIQNMLSNLDGGDSGDSWSQLSERLDINDAPISTEDLDFDDRIKSSLVDLNAVEMADWENFVSGLELAENIDNIDQDIIIDSSFKANLTDVKVDYDPNTWDALSAKLDLVDVLKHENTNQDIDQVAYDSLLNYTVPQRAGDWEALEEKLDREPVVALPLLYKYKLAEIAILTLLLLVFFQANPLSENNKPNNAIIAESTLLSQNTASIKNSIEVKSELQEVTDDIHVSKGLSSDESVPIQIQSATAQNESTSNNNSQATIQSPISANAETKSTNTNMGLADEKVLEVSSFPTPIINGKDKQTPKEKSNILVVVDEKQSDREFELALKTAKLPIGSLVNLDYDEKGIQVCKACFKPESILRWRLGAHLDAKYDYIMTAYDKVFDLESYNHSTFSYGAGLSTSILLGKWELESGFDYATRQYNTKTGEIIGNISNGYLKVKLDKIQMNVLSVPLNLRYHFKDQSAKTRFYVHAGATMNVATQANYFIKSEFLNNSRRPSPVQTNQLVKDSNTASDKIYSLGWFEGGTYLSNRYFYANLGIGFERKISSRYSIFGQTTYSHYLDKRGIGPNDDRFNSVGFSTGIRALFK